MNAMKPFATTTSNPVAEATVNPGRDFQSWGYMGLFAAVKPKRAMWWSPMKPRHLAGVDRRILRSEH